MTAPAAETIVTLSGHVKKVAVVGGGDAVALGVERV